MPLKLRVPYGQPLTYADLDGNLTYLLTNMSGSAISITGSTVGITSNTWLITPTNFTWYGQNMTLGSNSLGTGIQITGSLTQLGDVQGGNANTLFTVDDGKQIVTSNVGLNITGSTTINNILTLTPRTTTPSAGQFTTGSIIVSGSGAQTALYLYTGAGVAGGWAKITAV